MSKICLVLLSAALLAGCGPTRTTPEPSARPLAATQPRAAASDQFVWARLDGRRMATDPVLYRQGEADKAACQASASTSGQLDFAQFEQCMVGRGYMRRNVPG